MTTLVRALVYGGMAVAFSAVVFVVLAGLDLFFKSPHFSLLQKVALDVIVLWLVVSLGIYLADN